MRTTKGPRLARRCGIREAKTNLSGLVKELQSGREILITDRGRPVAKLVSVEADELSLAEWVKGLERRGLVEAGGLRKVLHRRVPLPLGGVPSGRAQAILREDRDLS
ncbi:MAG: type II toxin-antitoxin system prevent-host-death family antitoxin [Candidatus Eremiobacterota bacterium]